jgi:hypothetical protein
MNNNNGKRKPPRAGCGRPLGARNHYTVEIREGLLDVWFQLGGSAGMLAWVKKSNRNRGKFYELITRILPKQVEGTMNGNLTVNGQIDVVAAVSLVEERLKRAAAEGVLKDDTEEKIIRATTLKATNEFIKSALATDAISND